MEINNGISAGHRETLSTGLAHLLADSFSLYLKTLNFHWNVTGSLFQSLHALFMEQYTELTGAVDEIAERIRALGHKAPGSLGAFAGLTSIADAGTDVDANTMMQQVVDGHDTVARTARGILPKAEDAGDQVTVDLLVRRLEVHEKTAWMMRAMLET